MWFYVLSFCLAVSPIVAKEFVLTLGSGNFSAVVSRQKFIVVEFYAPWCGHCKTLYHEYEKAASILSSHDPPIALAKVDSSNEVNIGIASQYEIKAYPTLKIFKDGGKVIQDYKGPLDAQGIVDYVKKLSGPASLEIKSTEDASHLISDKKIVVVGVFHEFAGEEFDNFMVLAEKLRSKYEFGHTLDVKLLPLGEYSYTRPFLRLFKPFDELFVDFKDLKVDVMENFIEEASIPVVTVFDKDPNNYPYVIKLFNSTNTKAMLFMNFSGELADTFRSNFREVAEKYRSDGISFLLGDAENTQGAFQYYGLRSDQVPLIIIQKKDGEKYMKPNLEPGQLVASMIDFKDGKVSAFKKSEPIPTENNEAVKVVVGENFEDTILNSPKNVFLEFYAPWCGQCKKLASILDKIAVSLKTDTNVVIAKMDATSNDYPMTKFEVKSYPTLYFKSARGMIFKYQGHLLKEDIYNFIQTNQDTSESASSEQREAETSKDEL